MTSSNPSSSNPVEYFAKNSTQASPTGRRGRVWPAVVIVILMWLGIKVPALVAPGEMFQFMAMMWAPVLGLVAMIVWLLSASRLPWSTRWTALIALVAGIVFTVFAGHKSMGMGYMVFTLPLSLTVWGLFTLLANRMPEKTFRLGLAAVLFLSWALFTTLRMDGLDGSINAAISFRWRPTSEDRFLATLNSGGGAKKAATLPTTRITLATSDWPEFRGPKRDSKLAGVTIRTDWASRPPKLLWKHIVGPGWSSFCVVGDLAYTQEQRGQNEVVTCYNVLTGDEVWAHTNPTRFDEAIAGPGPRATPTFYNNCIYALGANGLLNCLNAATGATVWSRDIAAESGANVPQWGFSASPLISHDLVSVITGAPGKAVIAYNATTGAPAWSAGDGFSYGSTHLATLDNVEQLLFVSEKGAAAFDPTTGKQLWQHAFALSGGANRVIQPAIISGNEFLLGAAFGVGTRRVKVSRDANGQWIDQTVWTSRSVKPYYNDMVIHKSHLYGFDNATLICAGLDDGKSRWRATNSYGNGQVLLLVDQDLVLVLGEKGEAVLVDAKPDAFTEKASFQALNGKTWNHPVITNGKLLVRNGEEMACYDLK